MTPVPMQLDRARSEARLFEVPGDAPALLVVPAMGVNARGYDRLGEALAARGVTTLVSELRGGDSSSVRARRGVDYGYHELIEDTVRHVEWLRARGHVVNVLGHSLGGQLTTVSLARWYVDGAKLVLIGSGTVHYRAYDGLERWRVWLGTQVAGVIARGLGYFPGHRLGFGGLQGRGLITDWSNASRTGEFRSARHGPLEHRLSELAPEVLAIHVAGDDMAPKSATHALVRKLPRAQVTWAEVAAPSAPAKLNPHFRWMKEPAAAAERIATFLKAQ